ncbi:hypothetical protein COCNU_02G012240 [Cocos nucifera]|uniref:Uncharacterized protein n=1 Tax=Cocos nucifera TaxID=13894 RepID=A0A8K0HZS4_COCNU|nr:hypothetical protein COCNU_02G012240 [Cocos nucifera]
MEEALGTPHLLQRWNRGKPSSEEQGRSSGDASDGKNPCPDVGFEGKVETLNPFGSGACPVSTSEKTFPGFALEVVWVVKEGEQKPLNKGTSTTTPPIQASILFPDVSAGSSVTPTPACSAFGHVIAGVHDRWKCRPRGLLTVGGGGTEVTKNSEIWDSPTPPPTTGAFIRWLSSPS